MQKLNLLILSLCVSAFSALPAFALGEPVSMTEVGTNAVTEITSNKPMLFTIFGAVIAIAVLLMVFRKGKSAIA